MAQQRMLLGHVKGDKGDPGKNGENGTNGRDAKIASVTATADASHLDEPTVTAEVGGEPGAQTIDFQFKGLMGATGPAGPAGPSGPAGKDGENATTTSLATEGAPGLLRQLSGNANEVLLGSGEWGAYEGGGTKVTVGNSASPSTEGAKDGDVYLNNDSGLLSTFSKGVWSGAFVISGFNPNALPEGGNIADMTYAQIDAASKVAARYPERAQSYLGQTKSVALSGLSGATSVTMKLIGIAHDTDAFGALVGFTFQLTDGLVYTDFKMNDSNVTEGGWGTSKMRTTYINRIRTALPSDLKAVIKKVNKQYASSAAVGSLATSQDDLWLLSYKEVFGDAQGYASDGNHNWLKDEGTWYEWYQAHNTNGDRVIKQAGGSACIWWLRSVYSSSYFCYVYSDGSWGGSGASGTYLPCAGLCI